jgi:hypothetical protein
LNSGLSRQLFADLTGAPFFSQNDIILRGSNKVHLQSGSSTTISPGITVDTSNNVGIGKTNPTQKLDVGGNILGSGFLQGSGTGGAFRIHRTVCARTAFHANRSQSIAVVAFNATRNPFSSVCCYNRRLCIFACFTIKT